MQSIRVAHLKKIAWFLAIKLTVTDIAEAIASYNFHLSQVKRGKGITCSCITLSSTAIPRILP
jgi:hypothetical protein